MAKTTHATKPPGDEYSRISFAEQEKLAEGIVLPGFLNPHICVFRSDKILKAVKSFFPHGKGGFHLNKTRLDECYHPNRRREMEEDYAFLMVTFGGDYDRFVGMETMELKQH